MPNLFVVKDQKNLAELAPALLRPRTSATVRESALDAIRRANPGLDFDRITPGTVVLVPAVNGTRPRAPDDPVRQVADDLVARVRDGIESLLVSAEATEESRAAEKKEAQELFATALVKRLAAQFPDLSSNIDSVRATYRQDDVAAKKQLEDLRQSRELWAEDLAALHSLS